MFSVTETTIITIISVMDCLAERESVLRLHETRSFVADWSKAVLTPKRSTIVVFLYNLSRRIGRHWLATVTRFTTLPSPPFYI